MHSFICVSLINDEHTVLAFRGERGGERMEKKNVRVNYIYMYSDYYYSISKDSTGATTIFAIINISLFICLFMYLCNTFSYSTPSLKASKQCDHSKHTAHQQRLPAVMRRTLKSKTNQSKITSLRQGRTGEVASGCLPSHRQTRAPSRSIHGLPADSTLASWHAERRKPTGWPAACAASLFSWHIVLILHNDFKEEGTHKTTRLLFHCRGVMML